jgi:gamma-polyglutamate biosynthesis protein CapC
MGYEIALVGLVLALAWTGLTGYYPGGIIVPSYLVLMVHQPLAVAGTMAAALLAWALYLPAARCLLLFGRRRVVVLLLLGAGWVLAITAAAPALFPGTAEFRLLGWVVPGLIANHFERQGVLPTTASLITVTTLLYLLGLVAREVGL